MLPWAYVLPLEPTLSQYLRSAPCVPQRTDLRSTAGCPTGRLVPRSWEGGAWMTQAVRTTLLIAVMAFLVAVGPVVAIVGGNAVPVGQLRYVARILITNAGTQSQCTGTVVRPNVILTAAHCVVDPATRRTLPTGDFVVLTTGPNVNAGTIYAHTVQAIVHSPGYTVPTRRDDMALLQLASPSTAHVVRVAGAADAAWAYTAGRPMLVAGFGMHSPYSTYSPTLNGLQLAVMSDSACSMG